MDICDTQMLQDHIPYCLKMILLKKSDGINNLSQWDLHEK